MSANSLELEVQSFVAKIVFFYKGDSGFNIELLRNKGEPSSSLVEQREKKVGQDYAAAPHLKRSVRRLPHVSGNALIILVYNGAY
jgi:hypothetical protein